MKNYMNNLIFKLLPGAYVRGKIGRGAKEHNFLYDRNIIKQLNVESFSQYGQDAFIYWMVFGGKHEGIFMDVGGNDPITINNTYLFEQKGWKGIAFEPMKSQADKWINTRKTPCQNIAIGMVEDEVEFTEMNKHECSGIGIKNDEMEGAVTYKVKQRKLANIFKENNINHVDMISIDVEGYEMNVMNGIDFEEVDITCFCIENNRDGEIIPDMELRKFMIGKGYRLVARLTIDDIFIKESYFTNKEESV